MTGTAAGNVAGRAQAPAAVRSLGWVALATVVSWLGEYIHNLQELPQLTLLSPENSLVALTGVVLVGVWWLPPLRRAGSLLLWVWAALHLVVGAVVTVLPLAVLPFEPAQTLEHYLAHLIYGLAQLPLLTLMTLALRHRPAAKAQA